LVRERAIKQTRMNGCSRAVRGAVPTPVPATIRLELGRTHGAISRAVHPAVTPRILSMAAFCG